MYRRVGFLHYLHTPRSGAGVSNICKYIRPSICGPFGSLPSIIVLLLCFDMMLMQFQTFHSVVVQIVWRLSGMCCLNCLEFVFVVDDVYAFSALIYCCIEEIELLQ